MAWLYIHHPKRMGKLIELTGCVIEYEIEVNGSSNYLIFRAATSELILMVKFENADDLKSAHRVLIAALKAGREFIDTVEENMNVKSYD